MKWQTTSETSRRREPWTICAVTVNGVQRFELWHDKFPSRMGEFSTAKAAAEEAQRIELAGQA